MTTLACIMHCKMVGESAHHPATVDLYRLACDERGCVGGEEDDEVAHVFRRAAALDGLLLQDPAVVAFLVGVDLLGVRGEGAWCYGVHVDVVLAHFAGQAASEANDAPFRGYVVHQERPSYEEGDRGDVYDVAAAFALHVWIDGPGAQEIALEVNGHHPVPLLLLDLGPRPPRVDGGVVDKDVHPTQLLCHPLDGVLHRGTVGDIGLEGHTAVAREICGHTFGLLEDHIHGGDSGAGGRQGGANALAEAPA